MTDNVPISAVVTTLSIAMVPELYDKAGEIAEGLRYREAATR